MKNYKIAVGGTGYVGLSIATLLSQYHQVTAEDIIPEKVDLIVIAAPTNVYLKDLIEGKIGE